MRKAGGISRRSVLSRWFGGASVSSQNSVSAVSTRPLSGIGVGSTQSKALMRSVATMTSRSPRSYTSRTLPRRQGNPVA